MKPQTYNTVVGLDIGQHAVKAVRVTRRGKAAVVTHAETLRQPMGPALEWAGVIGRWLEQKGFLGDPCVVGLRGMNAMFQPLVLAPEDARPVGQAVAAEITRLNELSHEPMSYSFLPLPETEKGRRILLVLARPSATEAALAGPQAAGVTVADLVPTPVAVFNASGAADSPRPVVCVNIGMTATDMAVGSAAGLLYARSFGLGGQSFTDALARARKLSPQQAESVKSGEGLEPGADELSRQALTAAVDTWLGELRTCLNGYRTTVAGEAEQPVRVVLSGAGARLKGFDRLLAERLGMTVERLAALPAAAAGEVGADLYAVAYGLAASATGGEAARLSLLPATLREEMLLKQQKRYWIASALVAALILGVSVYGGYRDSQHKAREMGEKKETLARCQQLAREIDQIDAANKRLRGMSDNVAGLLENGSRFRSVVHAVARNYGSNDWITMIADADSYFSPLPAISTNGAARGRPNPRRPEAAELLEPAADGAAFSRMIIAGYTPDGGFTSVQQLIADLLATGFVKKADLLPDDQLVAEEEGEGKWERAGARRFVIEVTL